MKIPAISIGALVSLTFVIAVSLIRALRHAKSPSYDENPAQVAGGIVFVMGGIVGWCAASDGHPARSTLIQLIVGWAVGAVAGWVALSPMARRSSRG